MNFHFLLSSVSVIILAVWLCKTYHLEAVQLLLDLLSQHGRQAVASGNLSAAVILLGRPGIMEDDAGRKGSVSLAGRRGTRTALAVGSQAQGIHEVIFRTKSDRPGPSMALGVVIWRAWRARDGRIAHGRNLRQNELGGCQLIGSRRGARRAWSWGELVV